MMQVFSYKYSLLFLPVVMYPVMVNGIRTLYLHGLDKEFGSKFHVGSWIQQETHEEGHRMNWLKHCEYNNKDEYNSLDTLNDKNFTPFLCLVTYLQAFVFTFFSPCLRFMHFSLNLQKNTEQHKVDITVQMKAYELQTDTPTTLTWSGSTC